MVVARITAAECCFVAVCCGAVLESRAEQRTVSAIVVFFIALYALPDRGTWRVLWFFDGI